METNVATTTTTSKPVSSAVTTVSASGTSATVTTVSERPQQLFLYQFCGDHETFLLPCVALHNKVHFSIELCYTNDIHLLYLLH